MENNSKQDEFRKELKKYFDEIEIFKNDLYVYRTSLLYKTLVKNNKMLNMFSHKYEITFTQKDVEENENRQFYKDYNRMDGKYKKYKLTDKQICFIDDDILKKIIGNTGSVNTFYGYNYSNGCKHNITINKEKE